jgi:beta-lactamase class A
VEQKIMYPGNLVTLFVLLGNLLGFALMPSVSAAMNHYDVSYLWHKDIDNVLDYRVRVVKVLGPGVAKDLRVVAKGDLYGLIYHRNGSSSGAQKAASVHTRLLHSRGLETASPIVSEAWTFFGKEILANSLVESTARRDRMSGAERAQEKRDLEVAVEDYIKGLRRKGQIADDERTGWSVYDFTTGEKLVTINEDLQFQAASLIKPFIATAFFHRVKQGELIYGGKSRRHMERMIQQSNNWSTNWVMRQVGGPQAVERILKRNYPGIFKDVNIVEYIPANGRTYRNKASVHDYSRFLYAVWQDEIPKSREIKRLMSLPGSDRIYTGAHDLPEGTEVYNKTGSTARLCGDMGILNVEGHDGNRYPYIIIGIIEKQQSASNYTSWIRSRSDIIRNVSNIVYKGITKHHALAGVM